jgi:hypothetical protein
VLGKALGLGDAPYGEFLVSHPVKPKGCLKEMKAIAIVILAAAVECRPLRCVTSARAFSFRWRSPSPPKVWVTIRIALSGHGCGVVH